MRAHCRGLRLWPRRGAALSRLINLPVRGVSEALAQTWTQREKIGSEIIIMIMMMITHVLIVPVSVIRRRAVAPVTRTWIMVMTARKQCPTACICPRPNSDDASDSDYDTQLSSEPRRQAASVLFFFGALEHVQLFSSLKHY